MNGPKMTLTDGSPVPEDRSHTEHKPNGQQIGYVVLSEEERKKGFVRPVRKSYVHVGLPPPKNTLVDLTPEQIVRFGDSGFVKYETYPEGSTAHGRYWTLEEINKINNGCGVQTTMSLSLAETYAAQPSFYSGTFCCGCGKHFPVGERGEFVWFGTDIRVGT